MVLAPLAGGPSTPELAAAVSEAGGLGFLAWGYLKAPEAMTHLEAARRLTDHRLGVNVFHPGSPSDPASYWSYVEHLGRWSGARGLHTGEPRYDDDDWEAKVDLLVHDPVAVVSFTFGCPPADVVSRLQSVGSEVWVTVTSPAEAREAAEAGADALVAQGSEAGGHRGSFLNPDQLPLLGLLPLLDLVRAAVSLPLVASGGIASGPALAAVLCAGARAAQIGTAFMLAPEAGTHPAHRDALARPSDTVLTRAFTGRLARGIPNAFIEEHELSAPVAYPEVHYVTAPIRQQARRRGNPEHMNLWAGAAHQLAVARPADETVRELSSSARAALERVRAAF